MAFALTRRNGSTLADSGWQRPFDDPIPLPRGRQLVTLKDAGDYITKEESKLAVNKITWAQVGLVTEPGRYIFKFGWLTITEDDLVVWDQYPNAAFTLVRTTTTIAEAGEEVAEEYRLGTFELRENLSFNER